VERRDDQQHPWHQRLPFGSVPPVRCP
jgi:hypothetical protein